MDTVISRMMQLLGAILVLGMVASGVRCAQLQHFDGSIAFLMFGVVTAAIFTTIWTVATTCITKLIGKNSDRSQITNKSIVGISVGILALLTCVGFVTAGWAATNATDNSYSLWLYGLGSASTACLCIIWCCAEHKFVKNSKN
jgi:hypothetical protein